MLKLSDYDYDLPDELIAAKPIAERDGSRLMIIDRGRGFKEHRHFFDLINYLKLGDLLVFNNTKVFPARLVGYKISGGRSEMLLNKEISPGLWEVVGKGLKVGAEIHFFGSELKADIIQKNNDVYIASFNLSAESFFAELERIGLVPIPPYIAKKRLGHSSNSEDRERYQTIYAKKRGSVAAPTAGLHFTDNLINQLKNKGIHTAEITLHVGLGTFQPIKTEDVTEHKIHQEYFEIEKNVLEEIINAKKQNRRVLSVGTTTTRVLEYIFDQKRDILSTDFTAVSMGGMTDIYIYPGFRFKCIDGLITNFHLPKSSLLLLVSAFAGEENIRDCYRKAINEKYHFYSYGDAMLII